MMNLQHGTEGPVPALQIDFYCLCLFVRDAAKQRAHVVMPTTHESHKHLVRLYRVGANGKPQALLGHMEGLELVLGGASGMGSAALESLALAHGGRVVDLTKVTGDANGSGGLKATSDHVNQTHPDVVSRVRLGAGRAIQRKADAHWWFKNDKVLMAHTLTWLIDDVPDLLVWNRMSGTTPNPLNKLSDLGALQLLPLYGQKGPQKQGYRIRVSHTMGPDDVTGELSPEEVKEHFRHFYHALGHHNPGDDELPNPAFRVKFLGKFNCGTAQVDLA